MKFRPDHHLWVELREFTPALFGLLVFSFVIAMMHLLPSLYMLQMFDRVMQSRNISTLIALAMIVVFLTIIWTGIEYVRIKTMQRIAIAVDEKLSAKVFNAVNRQAGASLQSRNLALQDLNTIRDFLGGNLILNFMDFLFVPVIVVAAFMFHPWLGVTLLFLTVLVAGLAIGSQIMARDDMMRSSESAANAANFGQAVMNTAETTRTLGMLPALTLRWRARQQRAIGWFYGASSRSELFVNLLRFLRHMYLPIMVTCGVLLYLDEKLGPGVIFAAVTLVGRAVAPVDIIANSWRGFWNVRQAADRLDLVLKEAAKFTDRIPLPQPNGPLVVSRVGAAPRNSGTMILTDVSFSVDPGRVVAVVGASGAGKSTLARVLVGAWAIQRGSILLDGNEISHWDQDLLGQHIGYVPQDVDLLPGTLAENIARFEPSSRETSEKLIDAVRMTGIQDIVSRLPDGLNTRLGPDGHVLSSGQRQRIALARAVYGDPRLVVLDEPNSNLDATGEQQLAATISKLRNNGAIVILVTHRMNMLAYCDQVLVLNAGTVQAFGARDQVMDRIASVRPKELTDDRNRPGKPGGSIAAA
ncbi:MAG: type I secretion system permease/ATPase [Methylobacterium sp.]|nr:MAG: type I secretion system permease/ATPase [Methylobacterium sp.]